MITPGINVTDTLLLLIAFEQKWSQKRIFERNRVFINDPFV